MSANTANCSGYQEKFPKILRMYLVGMSGCFVLTSFWALYQGKEGKPDFGALKSWLGKASLEVWGEKTDKNMDITLRSNKSTIDIELSRNKSYIIRCQENLIYDQKLFFLTDKLKLRNTCLVSRLSSDMLTLGFFEVWSNFYLFFSSCNSGHVVLSKIISSEEHIGPVFNSLCLLTWKRVPSN